MAALSIRVRLTFAFLAAFGILLTVLSISLYRTASARLYGQADAQLSERAAALRPLFNISNSEVTWLVEQKALEQSSYLVAHAIFDDQGQFIAGSALANVYNLRFTEAARNALRTRAAVWETVVVQNTHRMRTLSLPITGSDGRSYLLIAGMLLDQAEDDLQQLIASLATLVPLVLAMSGLAGWWLAGGALQPVAEITARAKHISASSLAERLPLRGTQDELDRLSGQLNEMITRLQGSFEQMTQFISNVSHELRTPLAALRGSCEIALRNSRSEEDYRALLAGNIEELDRLARTVSDLLALARAEAGEILLRRRSEDVTELVRDAVESARILGMERGITVDFHADGEVRAEIDPEHVLRVLFNLLDNAIKYNRPNGRVEVSLGTQDGWVLLRVADTGRGIASEDLPHIFSRFYRGRIEGTGSVGGTGLGLSLANWVVSAHGGRIEVESEAGTGSQFRVWLPQSAPPEAVAPPAVPSMDLGHPVRQEKGQAGISREDDSERRESMLQNAVRWGYWLGIASAAVALLWRVAIAFGAPSRWEYDIDRNIGHGAFINGAVLFLLIAAATAAYIQVCERKS